MGSSSKNISYRYDAVGNRVGMTDPDGGRFTYSYDSLRRMTRVINPQGERTSYSYDDVGRRKLMKLANGTRTSYTYDPANRLTTLGNLKSDGTVISQFDYKYDNVGNRTAVKENDGSRVTYTYDNLYQLTGEHRTGTTPYRNTYTYDTRGNRTLKNESNVRTTYVYDACNQLRYSEAVGGRTTYTFDNDGNQTKVLEPTGARTTTTWDYENKATLTQLPSGVRNTMSYNTEGMRIKLEDSSGTKKYVWDKQNYLAETDANNDTQTVFTNEPQGYGNIISQRRNNSGVWIPSYYHYEALGSTRQLSNSSQTVTDTYLYDAWGNLINSTGTMVNPFRYVGRLGYYYDPDTTNYYIRARIYRPVIARWLSIDPLGFVDGMNLYKYCKQIPVYFKDPSGTRTWTCESALNVINTLRQDWNLLGFALSTELLDLFLGRRGGNRTTFDFSKYCRKILGNSFFESKLDSSLGFGCCGGNSRKSVSAKNPAFEVEYLPITSIAADVIDSKFDDLQDEEYAIGTAQFSHSSLAVSIGPYDRTTHCCKFSVTGNFEMTDTFAFWQGPIRQQSEIYDAGAFLQYNCNYPPVKWAIDCKNHTAIFLHCDPFVRPGEKL